MTDQEIKQRARELGEQPAFPRNYIVKEKHLRGVEPFTEVIPQPDFELTKREYFAGLAMQLKLSPVQGQKDDGKAQSRAIYAVKQADALLEELVKGRG